MSASIRTSLVVILLAIQAPAAAAQFGGGSLRGTSVAVSMNSTSGEFSKLVQTGMGLSIHTGGGGETGESWSGRSSVGFDRFGGKGTLDNVQFIGGGFDIVHHGTGWYQFAGITVSSTNYSYKTTLTPGVPDTTTHSRNGSNFGVTGGVGLNLGSSVGTHFFVEVAATTLFTSPKMSTWFPGRFGVAF